MHTFEPALTGLVVVLAVLAGAIIMRYRRQAGPLLPAVVAAYGVSAVCLLITALINDHPLNFLVGTVCTVAVAWIWHAVHPDQLARWVSSIHGPSLDQPAHRVEQPLPRAAGPGNLPGPPVPVARADLDKLPSMMAINELVGTR